MSSYCSHSSHCVCECIQCSSVWSSRDENHIHLVVLLVRHTFGSFSGKSQRCEAIFDHRQQQKLIEANQSVRIQVISFSVKYVVCGESPKAIQMSEIAFITVNVRKEQCTACVCVCVFARSFSFIFSI